MNRLFVFILLFLLLIALPVTAEEVITLNEAINRALSGNNEIKAKKWSLRAKENEKGVARSFLLPKISVEERFSRTNNPTYVFMSKLNQERFSAADFQISSLNNPDATNNYQTVFSIEQPVYVKKALVALDMSDQSIRTSHLELNRLKERIALNVFEAYINIVTAKEYLHVAYRGLEDTKEHQRIAELRYHSGLGLYSDVLRAKVAVLEAEKEIVKAEKGLSVAKRMLALLLGVGEPVNVAGNDMPDFLAKSIEGYLETAQGRNDVKAMEMRYKNAQNAVRLSRADYYPVIGIGGSYELDDHENPFGSEGQSWQVTAFLKVNLFDGLKRESEKSRAEHQVLEAYEYLEALKKQVEFEVHNAFLSVDEALKKQALMKTAVEAAEEGVRLVEKRYENSLAPIVSLLDAQVSLDKARADEIAVRGEYLIAIAELEYASGRILKLFNKDE